MCCAGIAVLKQNSHLTSLNLAVCREISDEGVAAVATLSNLRSLDLTFCDRITDAGAMHLSRYTFHDTSGSHFIIMVHKQSTLHHHV